MTKKEKKLTIEHFANMQLKPIVLPDGKEIFPPYVLVRYDRRKTHLPSPTFSTWSFLTQLLTDDGGQVHVEKIDHVIRKNDVRIINMLRTYYDNRPERFDLSRLSGLRTRLLTKDAYSALAKVFRVELIDFLTEIQKKRVAALLQNEHTFLFRHLMELLAELGIPYTAMLQDKRALKVALVAAIYTEHIFYKEQEIITRLDFETGSPLVEKYQHYLKEVRLSSMLDGFSALFFHISNEEIPIVIHLIKQLTGAQSHLSS